MTTAFSRAEQSGAVLEASRAPSVRNIQPARWRFDDDGSSVILFRALNRTLPVADESGHDLQASLGAAFEGLAIALSTRGLSLGPPEPERRAVAAGCEPVVRAAIIRPEDPEPDPMATWVGRRRSYRGVFPTADPADIRRLVALERSDARLILGTDRLAGLGVLHDAAAWSLESQPAFHAESWKWTRLVPSDPRYRRDGLTADCLALTGMKRLAASLALPPSRFAMMARVGMSQRVLSEAARIRSAGAGLVFCPRRTETSFDVGRRMYRLWLEITAVGFHVAMMSASANDADTRAALEEDCQVPPERRIANVFRVGRIADTAVAESPRLRVTELLV
ncbi:MAG: hypothetical protein ABIT20_06840 [Gemmatimonadaceae bacterium]